MKSSGIFELIASIIIFVMGVTMLKMDRAKAKWRVKLQRAFEGKRKQIVQSRANLFYFTFIVQFLDVDGSAKAGKWVLFVLPFITVLREGESSHLVYSTLELETKFRTNQVWRPSFLLAVSL